MVLKKRISKTKKSKQAKKVYEKTLMDCQTIELHRFGQKTVIDNRIFKIILNSFRKIWNGD